MKRKPTTRCDIVPVGKRRDGGTRFWCLLHKADATAKYGRRAKSCRYAAVLPVTRSEKRTIDIDEFPGGIALWGAVPPIYDTTNQPLDRGIHVHARLTPTGEKEIDASYRSVQLTKTGWPRSVQLNELDAIYFMVSSVFNFSTKRIACTECGYSHLDRDWFSVHPHKRHLCAGCGRHFRDTETAIGNPLAELRPLGSNAPPVKSSKRCVIKQADYPGGIQIWGSNPAFFRTGDRPEEDGIHLHAFPTKGPPFDDTFDEVVIDGVALDALMVRFLMAQSALPHIEGRVLALKCPKCQLPHFDLGELAYTPHEIHECRGCGCDFRAPGRLRMTIGNPMVEVVQRLGALSSKKVQQHSLDLIPETI